MPDLSFLPAVNASLNFLATILLLAGLVLIKQKKIALHRAVMITAFVVSCVFLILYLVHKAWRLVQFSALHTEFHGPLPVVIAYRVMLLTHVLLAMSIPFFAIRLILLGLADQREKHKKLARIAFPIWLYVSITGVIIYFMLYHFNTVE